MTQTQSVEQIQNALPYFTGSEQFYQHPLFQKFIYTDGVKYIADAASAYWLLDHIVISSLFRYQQIDLRLLSDILMLNDIH